ncbi:FtsQ-type POTRA domain-containing protein [uncultured Faecalicoccus sp.]|uniref:FtsQ-type POTRA domain-containing protein n=1 Tax=uncultured Faecalicoccus sp. TaxID=1971760 RepID=UPI0026236B04|nr:FtsQ-type POTRA domain-containing protein [uncultured Faecalicoccus sp.]
MVEKEKKSRIDLFSIRSIYVLSLLIFVLSSFLVYFFSSDSKVQAIQVDGNYYYSDQEILSAAHVTVNTRLWLTPAFQIKNKVEELPLIKDVDIERKDNSLKIKVKERNVIGYYVEKNQNYVLTRSGKSIKINSENLESILHFPLLSGFTEKQRKQIAKEFEKDKKVLNKEVIEKIAEIIPYESTYDANMLQITMQDGNKIFTSLDSLSMLANYADMLNQLEGKNVCLMLDSANSAIEKINCDALKKEKENKEDKEEKEDKEDTEDQEIQETQDPEETTPSQTPAQEPEQDPAAEDSQDPTTDYYSAASDWVQDQTFGLEYSATLDLYYDPGSGIYYSWNDSTLSFDVVN